MIQSSHPDPGYLCHYLEVDPLALRMAARLSLLRMASAARS